MENSNFNILEYLKNVSDLEGSVYKQGIINEEARKSLNVKPPKLKKPNIEKPANPNNGEPKAPEEPSVSIWVFLLLLSCGGAGFWFFMDLHILGIVSVVFAVICLLGISTYPSEKKEYHEKVAEYRKSLEEYKMYEKQYKKELEKYKVEYDEALKKNKMINKKEKQQFNEKMQLATKKVDELDECLIQTQEILDKAYSAEIIFPKYRNLVAVSTIYEYFASGRVSTLEGPNGAYNLYESELRQNLIINQLDTISQNLESIKNNQYVLYSQLHDLTETTKIISADLTNMLSLTEGIYENSRIDAYYSQVTASNTACIKNLAAMDYIFK